MFGDHNHRILTRGNNITTLQRNRRLDRDLITIIGTCGLEGIGPLSQSRCAFRFRCRAYIIDGDIVGWINTVHYMYDPWHVGILLKLLQW